MRQSRDSFASVRFPSDAVYSVHADHSDGSDNDEYFDALNRSVGTAWTLRGGSQGRQETVYNALGQVDKTSRPYVSGGTRYWVEYTYDLIGRVTEEDAPVSEGTPYGAITTTAYLADTVQVTDAENNVTKTQTNALGQIVKVTDANNNYATYAYDPFGELASMTDAESNTTTIDYDPRGFKTDLDDPNMGDWDYLYNLYGELVSQTNALTQTTTLAYDEAGRLEERVEAEGTTTWTYFSTGTGAKGKLASISAPGSYQETYSYFSANGLVAEVRRYIDSSWYDFEMTYDGEGRLNVLTYPESTSGYTFAVDYDYDAYGHLQYVKDGNEAYTYYTLNTTDALGRATDADLGNGRSSTWTFDRAAGYLKDIDTDGSVQDLTFTYDEVGNVLTRADGLISETETFTYDNLNRLATSQVTGESTVTMAYSAAGRITSKSDVGSYTYGAGGAGPFAVTSANGSSFTYDANGRMITRGSGEITWTSYDLPSQIDNLADSAYSQFWYGPDRARYKQYDSGAATTIRYVGGLFEFEDPDSGNDVYRHYVQAGDQVVAMVTREATGSPGNVKQYLHRDNQGSVTKVTDSAGSIDQALAFDPWGLRRDATDWSSLGSPFSGTHETERGYTGHEHLDTVGLVHMNGRVQDPVLGRFISADPTIQSPFGTQSHNRYSYVWNNPTTYLDPSGFTCELSNMTSCSPEDMNAMYEYFTNGIASLQGYWGETGLCDCDAGWMIQSMFNGIADWVGAWQAEFNPQFPTQPSEFDITYARIMRATYAAQMGNEVEPQDGYTLETTIDNDDSGLFAALWTNGDVAVLAFAGTQLLSASDWITDVRQGVGLSTRQYSQAMDLANQYSRDSRFNSVSFTGHSLGGGLAIAASAATGNFAIVFNPAGVTESTLARERRSLSNANVTTFYTNQDPLRVINAVTPGSVPGPGYSIGNGGHSIDFVCNRMGC